MTADSSGPGTRSKRTPRALYVSPVDVTANNGMLQRQAQIVAALDERYPGQVDVLTLGSAPGDVSKWLRTIPVNARVLTGLYPTLARLNTVTWYSGNVIACNKLRWSRQFRFPLRTPLPVRFINRYDVIVSYYAWAFVLLRLQRAGQKVITDLGDVLAERHDRIGTRRWISISSTEERAVISAPARSLAISDDDCAEFERLYGVRLPVVPFLHHRYRELMRPLVAPCRPTIGFLASRGYGNEEVLRLLCCNGFVARLTAFGVRLIIAGAICDNIDAATASRLRQAGMVIAGRVATLSDFYSQVNAVINPVGPSTGVKIKSVEALLAGRLLITTRYGADASLLDIFRESIVLVDWPIDALRLAETAVQSLRISGKRGDCIGLSQAPTTDAAAKYVRRVEHALNAAFGERPR